MTTVLVAIALVISVVLVWSGVAKLKQPDSMAEAMKSLKIPAMLSGRAIQIAVPWLELALAAALLVTGGIWQIIAWVGAVLLFGVYMWVIARALSSDEQANCNCFGVDSAPVDRDTLARNVLLLAASGLGLAGAVLRPAAVVTKLAGIGWEGWVGLVAIAVLIGLAWFIAREASASSTGEAHPASADPTGQLQLGELESEDPEDYIRKPIPHAVLEGEPGEYLLLPNLARERGVVLFYVSTSCGSCEQILSGMDDYVSRLPMLDVYVVVYSRAALAKLPESVQPRAMVDVAGSVQASLELTWVPGAVLLGADGLLAGGPVFGEAIDQLIDDVVEEFAFAQGEAAEEQAVPQEV
ncbi:MAG: MauE/DoxX family redox-associated membrane protein [Brooklawnia sp.]|jgi:hypothetical protein